jgi:hypothetical protein
MACSDLWVIHQRKCKEWQKGGSLLARPVMKSLLMGTGHYLCKVYNYHDSRACGYKRSGILPRVEGMVWEWDGWIWFSIALRYHVILCALCVLCDPVCTFVDQTV